MARHGDPVEVDVLVVGGGAQGLAILGELAERAFDAVLVTNAALGDGQTLHAHGVINTGYAAPDPALRASLLEDWLPFAADRGIELYGDDRFFAVLPSSAYAKLGPAWDAAGYPHEVVPADSLPAGFLEGDLFEGDEPVHVVRLTEYTVSKRAVVEALSDGLCDRVVRGSIEAIHVEPVDGSSAPEPSVAVDAVDVVVEATGESVGIAPGAVVLATGTGTKRLVRSMVDGPSFRAAASSTRHGDGSIEEGDSGASAGGDRATGDALEAAIESQLATITHERLHMICVRGPRERLPPVNLLLAATGTIVVTADVDEAHEHVAGSGGRGTGGAEAGDDRVTWYVTPQDPAWAHVEAVPDGADAEPDPALVARGLDTVLRAFPPLREAAAAPDSSVEFGVYAGFKQNVGDDRVTGLCAPLAGTANVVLALPTLLGGVWSNARAAVEHVEGGVEPSGRRTPVLGAGEGVRVGNVREHADGFEWRSLAAFAAAFAVDPDLGSP